MKRKEVALIEQMARSFSREIKSYLKALPDSAHGMAESNDQPHFESTIVLWNLCIEAAASEYSKGGSS